MFGIGKYWRPLMLVVPLTSLLVILGCRNTPFDVSDFSRGPAPLRMPSPAEEDCCYEDTLRGGHIFDMYCGMCHNARPLAERPFANFQNVAAHMRVRVNLTGKEYAQLVVFLRRWYDIPPPVQNEATEPKRFIYSQPILELRQQQPKTGADLPAGPRAGANDEVSPGQPAVGNSPREGR